MYMYMNGCYLLAEIDRNRDFYRSTDVRPPFTYASLIRQVNTAPNVCLCTVCSVVSYSCDMGMNLRQILKLEDNYLVPLPTY